MKNSILTPYLCPAACLAALWLGNTTGLAQSTSTWDGGASTANWNDGNNWNPNAVPVGSDATTQAAPYPANMTNAILPDLTTPYTVDYSGTAGLVNNLTITKATLNVTGTFQVLGPNNTAAYGNTSLNTATLNIAPGADFTSACNLVANLGSTVNVESGATNRVSNRTSGGATLREGSLLTVWGDMILNRARGIVIRNSDDTYGSTMLTVSGGKLESPLYGGSRGSITLGQSSTAGTANTLNVTNNGTVIMGGISLGGIFNTSATTGGINHNAVHLSSGTVSLGQTVILGQPGGAAGGSHNNAQRVSTNTVTMTGGSLSAGTGIIAGAGRVGIVNLSGGALSTGAGAHLDIGGFITGLITPTTAAHYGAVNVSGGSLTVGVGGTIRLAGSVLQNSTQVYDGFWSPGSLNLTGGTVTTDALVATNGAFSAITFAGGTLRVNTATEIDNGVAFTVGNGTAEALLELGDGSAHTFTDGAVINTNAVLAVGGTNAIGAAAVTGNLTLRTGAVLDLDFNATTNDWLQVTGTVTLPAVGTLRARTLDSSARTPIPVLQATSITGSVAGWSVSRINDSDYRAFVSGNQLLLEKIPRGTMIVIR